MKKYLLIVSAIFVAGFITGVILYLNDISYGKNTLLLSSGLISMLLLPLLGLTQFRNAEKKSDKILSLATTTLLIFTNISILFTLLNFSGKESVYWTVVVIFLLYSILSIIKYISEKVDSKNWLDLIIKTFLLSVLGIFVFNGVSKEEVNKLYSLELELQESLKIQENNTNTWYKNIESLKNENSTEALIYITNTEKIKQSTINIIKYIDSVKTETFKLIATDNDSLAQNSNFHTVQKAHDLFCGYINNQKDTIEGVGLQIKHKLIEYRSTIYKLSAFSNEISLPLNIVNDSTNKEKIQKIDAWVYNQFANKMLIQDVLLLSKFQNDIYYIENEAVRNMYSKAWVVIKNKKELPIK